MDIILVRYKPGMSLYPSLHQGASELKYDCSVDPLRRLLFSSGREEPYRLIVSIVEHVRTAEPFLYLRRAAMEPLLKLGAEVVLRALIRSEDKRAMSTLRSILFFRRRGIDGWHEVRQEQIVDILTEEDPADNGGLIAVAASRLAGTSAGRKAWSHLYSLLG